MRRRSVIKVAKNGIMITAMAIGLMTIGLCYIYITRVVEKHPPVPPPGLSEKPAPIRVPVVYAVRDIPAKQIIDVPMLTVKNTEAERVDPDAISSIDEVVGQFSRVAIKSDSPILRDQIYSGNRLSYVIPGERRAATIVVDNTGAVSYLVKPGDIVDVIGTFSENFAGEDVAKIIVQNAQVMATGQTYRPLSEKKTEDDEEKPPEVFDTVTLAITPEEAEKLILGADKAMRFRLILRNPDSLAQTWTQGATPQDLFGNRLSQGKVEIFKGINHIVWVENELRR
ncbi:MAG: Flp pilus assembly protein CpaB [bacterium]